MLKVTTATGFIRRASKPNTGNKETCASPSVSPCATPRITMKTEHVEVGDDEQDVPSTSRFDHEVPTSPLQAPRGLGRLFTKRKSQAAGPSLSSTPTAGDTTTNGSTNEPTASPTTLPTVSSSTRMGQQKSMLRSRQKDLVR